MYNYAQHVCDDSQNLLNVKIMRKITLLYTSKENV